jgi:hypothetical protein
MIGRAGVGWTAEEIGNLIAIGVGASGLPR